MSGEHKEARNWISQDLDAISRPAMESVANSRWMAKTVKHLQSKGGHQHALNLTSGAHEMLQKNLLPSLMQLRTLETLNYQDFSSAFDSLMNLEGFADWRPQMTSLQKRIASLQERKVDLRKNRALFHTVILSSDSKLAERFSMHYHAVLQACGALSSDEKAVRTDGTNDRVLDQAHGCGMCLIQNTEQLSSEGTDKLSSRMRSPDTVFVANYAKSEDVSAKFLEERFFLRFDFLEALSKNTGGMILDTVRSWLEENLKELEGGVDGIYARTFASRIAENKTNEEGSTEERLKLALAEVLTRHDVRLELSHANGVEADQSWISRSDLLGQEPDIESLHTPAWDALQSLIRLDKVKASLKSFLNGVLLDFHRETQGMKPLRSSLSRLFLGPPGTGKTTVGKLYREILSHFGLLSSGEFIFKNATDFISPHLRQSEERTKTIIREAKGKVLIINKAYILDPYRNRIATGADPYHQAVINTLVGEVQNSPGEDICMIIYSYQEEMKLMLQRANPGLAHRFPVANTFVFKEFDLRQLEKVLKLKIEVEVGCTITPEAKKLAIQILSFAKQQPNFRNSSNVDNLLSRAMANFRIRFSDIPPESQSGEVCFQSKDLDPTLETAHQVEDQINPLLEGLLGIQDLKDRFISLARRTTSIRLSGRNPVQFIPFHFIFKDKDHTGKRAIARKLNSLYHTMRLLPTNQVVETSAQELLAERIPKSFGRAVAGQSSKLLELMEQSIGKVLYIGEAHQLMGSINDQNEKVIREIRNELIETVNKPRYLRRMLVILGGHETSMDKLLKENPNFANRFRDKLRFQPLTGEFCYDILIRQLQAEGFAVVVKMEEQEKIKQAFEALSQSNQWAGVEEIQEVTNQLVGDTFEKGIEKDCQPSVTNSEILHVLQTRYPRAGTNLSRLHEDRQKIGQIITERNA